MNITKKRADLLEFIRAYTQEKGISPSFDEMKEGIGIKSKSGVHRLLTSLVERGHLARTNYRARALFVIEQTPENNLLQLENRLLKDEVARLRADLTKAHSDIYVLRTGARVA